jgi:hypothetical protein
MIRFCMMQPMVAYSRELPVISENPEAENTLADPDENTVGEAIV